MVVVRRKWEWCTNWMWCEWQKLTWIKNISVLRLARHCSLHYSIERQRRAVVAAASNWILTSRLGADTSTNMKLSFFPCCSLTLSQIYLVSVLLCRWKELMPWNDHSPTLHKMRRILSALDYPHLQRVILGVSSTHGIMSLAMQSYGNSSLSYQTICRATSSMR